MGPREKFDRDKKVVVLSPISLLYSKVVITWNGIVCMPPTPESRLWKNLRQNTVGYPIHWTRLESWSTPGVPDVHGMWEGKSFWIELKIDRNKKVRPNLKKLLRPHQISWQTSYSKHGGKVFNLVHRPTPSLLDLYQGGWGVMEGESEPLWGGGDKDWKGLMDHLRSLID